MKPLRRILITEYSLVEDIIRELSTDKNIARDKRRLRRLHRKLVRLSAHVYDETFTVLLHKVIKDFPDNTPVQYEEYEQDLQAMLAYVIKYEKTLRLRSHVYRVPKLLLKRMKQEHLLSEKQNVLYGLKQLAKRGYAGGFDLAQRSVWDILDNLEYPEPPVTVEQSSSSLLQCVQGVEPLFSYGDGVWLMKEVAGRRSEKTQHAHYNYLIRDGLTTTVLFIDPEHHVGTWGTGRDSLHNLLRPPIVNLFEVTCRGDKVVRLNIIRYQMFSNVSPRELVRPATQLSQRLPCDENHVLFRLSLQESKCVVQSRYCSEGTLKAFLQGIARDAYLHNKLESFKSWLQRAVDGQYKSTRTINYKKP